MSARELRPDSRGRVGIASPVTRAGKELAPYYRFDIDAAGVVTLTPLQIIVQLSPTPTTTPKEPAHA